MMLTNQSLTLNKPQRAGRQFLSNHWSQGINVYSLTSRQVVAGGFWQSQGENANKLYGAVPNTLKEDRDLFLNTCQQLTGQ